MALKLALLHALITGDSSGYVKATQTAETATTKFNARIKAMGTQASKTFGSISSFVGGNKARQLSLQLSQVGQMAMVTGQPLRALAVQLPDMGLAFGAVGAAVGLLAGVGLPMLVGALGGTEDQVNNTKQAMDDLASSANRVEAANAILESSVDDLVEKYGAAATQVRAYAAALLDLERVEIEQTLRDQVGELDKLVGRYSTASDSIRSVRNVLGALRKDFEINRDEAVLLEAAFDDLGSALTFDQQQDALMNIWKLLESMGIEAAKLPPELREAVQSAFQLIIQAAEVTTQLDAATGKADELGTALAGAAMNFGNIGALSGLMDAELLPPTGTPEKPKRKTSRSNSLENRLERLRETLATEIELEQAHYATQQELLKQALEQQLLTREEYNALFEQAQTAHNQRMAQLDVYKYGDSLARTETFFGQMADAFEGGNDKMLQIAKVFGAGEALVNAWRTYSQVMSDPSLPWYAKLPAAINLFTNAVKAVSAIQGVGKGGSGQKNTGGASAGSIEATGEASQSLSRSLTLIGDNFNRQQAITIAEFMNEGTDNGLIVRGS